MLTQCKAGCQPNGTVTNHVMYHIAIALQKMLNLCYEHSKSIDIIFNHIKSQCMVFKRNQKLDRPAVYLTKKTLKMRYKKTKCLYVY